MSLNSRTFRRLFTFAVALSVLMIPLGVTTASSAADVTPAGSGDSQHEFAVQARNLGLTDPQARALQARVDDYLTKTGGTQVAVNKIHLSGADILLAIPGEKVGRDLGAQAAVFGCQYGHMCAFSRQYFEGDVIDMHQCGIYSIPWTGNGSWDNNQSTGTQADFRDANGNVGWISLGAHSLDLNSPWGWVHSIRNC